MVCLLDAVIFLSVDIRRMDDGLRQGIKTERFSKIGWIKGSGSIDRCIVYLPRHCSLIRSKIAQCWAEYGKIRQRNKEILRF